MNETGDENIRVSNADMHGLTNRLTVVKGLAQLLDRQLRRNDWNSSVISAKARALLVEIASMEDALARIKGSGDRSRANGHDRLLHDIPTHGDRDVGK